MWLVLALIASAGAAALFVEGTGFAPGRSAYSVPLPWDGPPRRSATASVSPLTDFNEPLNAALIDRSIGDAVRFYEAGDQAATLAFSRSCHNSLRAAPSLAWFDACAAFDEATAILNSDNALAEAGPFSASAVIARHMGSARIMARDMLAADSRVHDIRSRVEFALVPRMDDPAAVQQQL